MVPWSATAMGSMTTRPPLASAASTVLAASSVAR